MKRLLITLLLTAALYAQEWTSRVVKINHLNIDTARTVLDTLSAGRAKWNADERARLVIVTGPESVVNVIETAIKNLDVASPAAKNVDLVFYILAAGGEAGNAALPADLAPVVQQLGNTFGLKSFRLLESAALRGYEGQEFSTSGLLNVPSPGGAKASYIVGCRRLRTTPADGSPTINLNRLEFRINFPKPHIADKEGKDTQSSYLHAGFTTDIDIKSGQKVVVGKTSLDTATPAVFLVVAAKVAN
ncbi:MAG TPA: secretin N-terminal domain-containing protein [Bryobacteraceae bacterium]|nr:secretin N-terminal domain-containing protein [Bryobacteraceae bacterium]